MVMGRRGKGLDFEATKGDVDDVGHGGYAAIAAELPGSIGGPGGQDLG